MCEERTSEGNLMGKPSMWLRINTCARSHMEVLMKSIMQVFETCQRLGLPTSPNTATARD